MSSPKSSLSPDGVESAHDTIEVPRGQHFRYQDNGPRALGLPDSATSSSSSHTEPTQDLDHLLLPSLGRKKRELGGTPSPSSGLSPTQSSRSNSGTSPLALAAAAAAAQNQHQQQQQSSQSSQSSLPPSPLASDDDNAGVVRLHMRDDPSYLDVSGTPSQWAEPTPDLLRIVREADAIVRHDNRPAGSYPTGDSSAASSSSAASAHSPEGLLRAYGSYSSRLASFGSNLWPHTRSSHPRLGPAILAAAGFFRHQGVPAVCPRDCVMCYACGVELCDFVPDDDAEQAHRQAQRDTSVMCPFLQAIDQAKMASAFGFDAANYAGGASAEFSSSHSHGVSSSSPAPAAVRPSTGNPELDLLLEDLDADAMLPTDGGEERKDARSADAHDADSDALPPFFPNASTTNSLARLSSQEERALTELVESDADRHRLVKATRSEAIVATGSAVRKRAESTDESLGVRPVVIQARQPLKAFASGETIGEEADTMYFQVVLTAITYPPPPPPEGTVAIDIGDAYSALPSGSPRADARAVAADGAVAAAAASSAYPSFLIGLSTSALHSQSLPPGFEAPSVDQLHIGLSSDGDLFLNGMGPLTGVTAMQNGHFWPYNSGADGGPTHEWKPADIIGCRIDLARGVLFWHINQQSLGPVLLPGFSRSVAYYPTFSLLHPGDGFTLLTEHPSLGGASSSASASSIQSPGFASAARDSLLARSPQLALMQMVPLESPSVLTATAIQQLEAYKPDLGLVLDQTNSKSQQGAKNTNKAPVSVPGTSPGTVVMIHTAEPIAAGPVVISRILPGFSAAAAGLQVGDILRSINGQAIRYLKDAVVVVTARTPGDLLHLHVTRSGRECLLSLTLGAKGLGSGKFCALARWKQWRNGDMEWIGPPVGKRLTAGSRPGSSAGQSSSSSSSTSPPSYDPSSKAETGVMHLRALEVTLLVENRLAKARFAQREAPLYQAEYQTLASRMQSFKKQMQAWTSSSSSSSSAVSPLSPTGSGLLPPVKPLNIALHGFFYSPVPGFSGRVCCFACGVVVHKVTTISALIAAHRQQAQLARQAHAASPPSTGLATLDRPPSYHRAASLLPAALESGCLFLTMYDSATEMLKQKATKQQPKQGKPVGQAAASVSSAGAALSRQQIVIDIEADAAGEVEGAHLLASGVTSTTPAPLGGSTSQMKKFRSFDAPVVPKTDHLARDTATNRPFATADASSSSMGKDPPDFDVAMLQESIPVGVRSSPAGDAHPYSPKPGEARVPGLVYQSARQARPNEVRVGEFSQGSVDLRGRRPLSSLELRHRERGREDQGRHYIDADGIEVIPLGPDIVPNGAVVDRPPEPPPDPMEALRTFFCAGPKIFLVCKIPFFLLVLPFFLVWELLKGCWEGAAWCCGKCEDLCDRCCGCCSRCCRACCDAISDACERCCSFICCTVLCDGICRPIGRAISYCCSAINRYCCVPIGRCLEYVCDKFGQCLRAICDAIGSCCSWLSQTFCVPVCRCLSACCLAVEDALGRCFDAIGHCFSAIGHAVSRCCSWFWPPIFNAIGRCLSAIWSAIASCFGAIWSCICSCFRSIGRCCTWVWTPICTCIGDACSACWDGISYVCRAISDCASWVCRGISRYCSWLCDRLSACCTCICEGISAVCSAVGRCLNYFILAPIKWFLTGVWSCLSAIASFVWTSILAPIGRAVRCVAKSIGDCIGAVFGAIWAVLRAIGSGIAAVFTAIYQGVLAPVGRSVRDAGRAIRDLCR